MVRTFQDTHPWITFHADLSRIDFRVWMLIGEARSKCEHINGTPLHPETARRLYLIYLSKGAFATTSIEGNTLSEEQVLQRVEGTLKLPDSQEYLGVGVDNIVDACNLIADDVQQGRPLELTPARVRHFNRLVLQNLTLDEDTVPGECRRHSVVVGNYRGAPADDCEYLLEQLCSWLNGGDFATEDPALVFAYAVLKAVLAHIYIAWIHPFGDGNGRTARLIELQLLMQSGLISMPATHLLSNHYNQTRSRYYQELERASKTRDISDFVRYALEGFVDGLRNQLDVVRDQQIQVTWKNYVHERFRGKDTPARRRQKHVVLDMPMGPIKRAEIRSVSDRVRDEYASKTEKTLTRDLNELLRLGLVVREGGEVAANYDLIHAFLPPRVSDDV